MSVNPQQQEKRDKRNAEIVKLYPQLTLMEIGKRYNISNEQVRRVLQKVAVKSSVKTNNNKK